MTLSIISLVVALVALLVNVSALLRRPSIVAEWGPVQDTQDVEGLTITVTARRRPVEVAEVGIVLLSSRTWRRRIPEWRHTERPRRLRLDVDADLPVTLSDGQTVHGFTHTEWAADEFRYETGTEYCYVVASGMVYLSRAQGLRVRLRRRRRIDEG